MVLQPPRAAAVPPAALRALRRAIAERPNARVLHGKALAARIGSRPPSARALEAPSDDVLGREARELLEVVAFGRDDEAIAQGKSVLKREAPRLTVTNRSELAARALGDVCLFVVRALEHRGGAAEATAQVRECLRLVPDLSASPDTHPEPVRRLVERSRASETSPLSVTASAATLPNCEVRVQGRPVGKLGSSIALVSGRYAVEVDCGTAGWIHSAIVRAGRGASLNVSPRLEQALRWDAAFLTLYASAEPRVLETDLRELANWLQVSELWTVEHAEGRLRVQRLRRSGGGLSRRVASTSPQPAAGVADRMAEIVAALTCEGADCDASPPRTAPFPRASLAAMSGLGGAAMLGSWVAWYSYADLNAQLDDIRNDTPEYQRTLSARNQRRDLAIVASSSGATLFALGLPFWLPERQRVPLWAWYAGALGVAATATGTVLWLKPGDPYRIKNCPEESCTRTPSNVPLAPMLVTQGASLIAVPVTYLVRGWTRVDSITVGVDASPGRVQIAWSQAVPGL